MNHRDPTTHIRTEVRTLRAALREHRDDCRTCIESAWENSPGCPVSVKLFQRLSDLYGEAEDYDMDLEDDR